MIDYKEYTLFFKEMARAHEKAIKNSNRLPMVKLQRECVAEKSI
jgi:hypothetical protein